MGRLLDAYNEMSKQAQVELEKQAEFEYLEKVAATAEYMLNQEYGEDYSAADVEKLAAYLIEMDIANQEQAEKIAMYEDQGRIMARGFLAELQKED